MGDESCKEGRRFLFRELTVPIALLGIFVSGSLGLMTWVQSSIAKHETKDHHKGTPLIAKAAVAEHEERRIDKAHPDAASKAELQLLAAEMRSRLSRIEEKQEEVIELLGGRRRHQRQRQDR